MTQLFLKLYSLYISFKAVRFQLIVYSFPLIPTLCIGLNVNSSFMFRFYQEYMKIEVRVLLIKFQIPTSTCY